MGASARHVPHRRSTGDPLLKTQIALAMMECGWHRGEYVQYRSPPLRDINSNDHARQGFLRRRGARREGMALS